MLALRHRGEYEEAKEEAMMARQEAGEKEGNMCGTPAGGGLNAVKARANIKQIRAMSSQGKRARGADAQPSGSNVTIEVFAK